MGRVVGAGRARIRAMSQARVLGERVVRIAQIVVGVLFVWAALAKLGNLAGFALQVHNFRVVPVALENLIAMTVPWIELVAGLALVTGIRRRAAAVVASTLLAVFTIAVLAALARGLDIECGCFGTSDASRVGVAKVLQNLAMLAAAIVAAAPGRLVVGRTARTLGGETV
jgi:uncharacterized membrane protein YphA (DoxX/SURF4 family)